MFNSTVLDVGVGLVIVFFLFSTICSAVREGIAHLLSEREEGLLRGICAALGAPAADETILSKTAKDVLAHPLVRGTRQDRRRGASYVSARSFSLALLRVLSPDGGTTDKFAQVKDTVANLSDENLKEVLVPLIDAAGSDLSKLQRLIALHYDEAMARVSGWYKRRSQLCVLLTAAIATVAGNIDTIAIASSLYREPVIRAQTVAVAAELVQRSPPPPDTSAYQYAVAGLQQLTVPMGWTGLPHDTTEWILKIAGLAITVIALTLGAPFWFDVLSKLASLRSAGPRPPLAQDADEAGHAARPDAA